MKCPHCGTAIKVRWSESRVIDLRKDEEQDLGASVGVESCPSCGNFLAKYQYGIVHAGEFGETIGIIHEEALIFPLGARRPLNREVPEPYRSEFQEACGVLNISPKASAALSRRVLQNVLRDEFDIEHRSLFKEIEEFIAKDGVPPYLSGAVDAVRNIGNIAAHPQKNTNTGSIVSVEPGEAEWLLDVLEALFEFTFVQPKLLKERKKKLNEKLENIGKPPMQD